MVLITEIFLTNFCENFSKIEKRIISLQNLAGPVYDVDRHNHFSGILQNIQELKQLNGPVYDIARNHNFNEIEQHVSGLEKLQGPIYKILHEHHYSDIPARPGPGEDLKGPVYDIQRAHGFKEILKSIPKIYNLTQKFQICVRMLDMGQQTLPDNELYRTFHPKNEFLSIRNQFSF